MNLRLVIISVLLATIGPCVLTNPAFRRRQIMRKVSERVEGIDRFVDVGVTFITVVPDPNGQSLIEGKPPVREVRRRHMGGIADTKSVPPALVGASSNPRIWYVSEQQEAALFHTDETRLGQLIHGSEGAGKTRLLAMWQYVIWIRHFGQNKEVGQTAPTVKRMEMVLREMVDIYSPSWFRYSTSRERMTMCDGHRIQLVSTTRTSAAAGSPVQGYNWVGCGRDEAQDSVAVHEDIESRGRSAEAGRYWQLATATAKDDSAWRDLHDRLIASGQWVKRNLSIFRSPFVPRAFIESKKASMSAREFLRRYGDPETGEVGDLPPELAVYYGWMRKRNLTALPRVGALNVTAALLSSYQSYCRPGARFAMIGCHDPGSIYNTTELLSLYVIADVPVWKVVGEFQTEQTTAAVHAHRLKLFLRSEFGLELEPLKSNPNPSAKVAIFCDPHGKGEAQTDYQSVYMAMQKEGLDVFNPSPITARIKRSARIEMVNRLMGDADGRSRLDIVQRDNGTSVAPKLVEAFETLKKRPGDDDPEGSQRKDSSDKTHAPAALAYGLWPFEQEAFTKMTQITAMAEARRAR